MERFPYFFPKGTWSGPNEANVLAETMKSGLFLGQEERRALSQSILLCGLEMCSRHAARSALRSLLPGSYFKPLCALYGEPRHVLFMGNLSKGLAKTNSLPSLLRRLAKWGQNESVPKCIAVNTFPAWLIPIHFQGTALILSMPLFARVWHTWQEKSLPDLDTSLIYLPLLPPDSK